MGARAISIARSVCLKVCRFRKGLRDKVLTGCSAYRTGRGIGGETTQVDEIHQAKEDPTGCIDGGGADMRKMAFSIGFLVTIMFGARGVRCLGMRKTGLVVKLRVYKMRNEKSCSNTVHTICIQHLTMKCSMMGVVDGEIVDGEIVAIMCSATCCYPHSFRADEFYSLIHWAPLALLVRLDRKIIPKFP